MSDEQTLGDSFTFEAAQASYSVHILRYMLGGRAVELLAPVRPYELLDAPEVQARFARDEYMPYWAELWPASIVVADELARGRPWGAGRLLEIGCGLGLCALGAALGGWQVLATDYDEDALAFVRASARRNGLAVETRALDWRTPGAAGTFDCIVACEVLYERRNHAPVATLIAHFLGEDGAALVADPGRAVAAHAEREFAAAGLTMARREIRSTLPGVPEVVNVMRVRKR